MIPRVFFICGVVKTCAFVKMYLCYNHFLQSKVLSRGQDGRRFRNLPFPITFRMIEPIFLIPDKKVKFSAGALTQRILARIFTGHHIYPFVVFERV